MGATGNVLHPNDPPVAFSLLGLPNAKMLITSIAFAAFVFLLTSSFSLALAAEWYVDASLSQSGDGTSWETALKTIQEGIDAASDGDTVIVAQGTYRQNIHFRGKNIIVQSTDPFDSVLVQGTIIDGGYRHSVVSFSGTEDERCSLFGFTIRHGKADYGGGVRGGPWEHRTRASILNNIIVDNSVSWRGGGLQYCNGRIQGNVIRGNSSEGLGGGLCNCYGVIQNNIITGNNGGGLCFCDATIKNNLICENTGSGLICCKGTIQNNTVVRNSGRGVSECLGTIRNCIIWGNMSRGGPLPPIRWLENTQLFRSSIPTYSCIQDWTGGREGNIAEDPRFVDVDGGDFHLQEDSPCIDSALNYYWFLWPDRDAEGNCRLVGEGVDIGCFEYRSSKDSDGDLLCDADEGERGTDPHMEDTDGDSLRDGVEVLRGSNPLITTPPRVVHVSSEVPSIQESLCLAANGDQIVVAPGTYYQNLQFCGADVVLRSSEPENPEVMASTILDGGSKEHPLPCIDMDGRGRGPTVSFTGTENEACVLAGFTIRNGRSSRGGGIRGGTLAYHTRATIEHNLIMRNSAPRTYGYGGGLVFCDGLIRNNTITENSAERHGGLSHCGGVIERNIISGNSGRDTGGGLTECHGVIKNNLIVGNSAGGYGGGLYRCDGRIENNTICGNKGHRGGGLDTCLGIIRNCIIWNNSADYMPQLGDRSQAGYSCIQGGSRGGLGNISSDPRFVDPDGADDDPETCEDNDYRLAEGSPCIDAGKNEDWMWQAVDLDRRPRILYGTSSLTVDIGAYEYWPEWAVRAHPERAEINYATGTFSVPFSIAGFPYASPAAFSLWLVVKDVVFTLPGPDSEGRLWNPDGITSQAYPDSGEYHYRILHVHFPYKDITNVLSADLGQPPEVLLEFYIKDRNPNFEPVIELWACRPVTGSDPDGLQPSEHPDGDGDQEEHSAGEAPAAPRPYLRVQRVLSQPGGKILLRWESREGAVYVVEAADTPMGPWLPISDEILSGGDITEWGDSPSGEIKCRFYRIREASP